MIAMAEVQQDKSAPRSIRTLVPLIKEDLRKGDEAAQKAGLPFYRAAGEKLLEAKQQIAHGEFQVWIKRNFKISPRQARLYMSYSMHAQNGAAAPFSSLNDFRREHLGHASAGGHPSWHKPVKEALDGIDFEALRQAASQQADERKVLRQLMLQMIDVGYRALAAKLHPDKGGSSEGMVRLNEARDRLKKHIGKV
jgi:hypothetical protein